MADGKLKVGVLFSQSGPMAVTENAHLQGVLLACEEINKKGGVDGQLLDPIIMNPAGDDRRFAEMATELLLKHRVNSIFGCCLSSSRKAVLPVIERFNGVLFYPSVYEGFEYSPNVIYGGAVPNQLVIPLLEYIYANYGQRLALVGSDTLYAREINRIVKEFLSGSEGKVVAETYLPFGINVDDTNTILRKVSAKEPDIILSTVVGEDSITFYNAYGCIKQTGKKVPIASLTTTESELAKMNKTAREGNIAVASYFGSIETAENRKFSKAFQNRYGPESIPGVYSEVGYSLVHVFADAIRLAGQSDSESILAALSGAVFKSPGGDLFIDIETNHFTLRPYVAKSTKQGQYEVLWKSRSVIRPDPYLVSYDRSVGSQVV